MKEKRLKKEELIKERKMRRGQNENSQPTGNRKESEAETKQPERKRRRPGGCCGRVRRK